MSRPRAASGRRPAQRQPGAENGPSKGVNPTDQRRPAQQKPVVNGNLYGGDSETESTDYEEESDEDARESLEVSSDEGMDEEDEEGDSEEESSEEEDDASDNF
jgi:hypothetical protein